MRSSKGTHTHTHMHTYTHTSYSLADSPIPIHTFPFGNTNQIRDINIDVRAASTDGRATLYKNDQTHILEEKM
jgi:hypothetical protein